VISSGAVKKTPPPAAMAAMRREPFDERRKE
jgi:hypothetical protein